MAYYPTVLKDFALKKESVRGTAEAAPAKYLKVAKDSSLAYSLDHVENDYIQNIITPFVPDAGLKRGVGKLTFDLEAQTIGEFLYSLMGTFSSAQITTSTAYNHTFSETTGTQHQAYTFFEGRDIDYFRYNLGVVKSLEFIVPNNGRCTVNAELLFKAEATAASYSPTLSASDPLMSYQVSVELDDVANTNVRDFKLKVDNGAEAVWVFDASQNCNDIIIAKKLMVEGEFSIYFSDTSHRDTFLNNTSRKIECIITGDTITGANKYAFISTIYAAKYVAVPFDSELEGGLQGAAVAFRGFYSAADSKAIDFQIRNTDTTY